LGAIVVVEYVSAFLSLKLSKEWLQFPGTISLVAMAISAIVLEYMAAAHWPCSQFPHDLRKRFVLYAAAWIVGIFLSVAVSPSHEISFEYRSAVAVVILLPLLVVAWTHEAFARGEGHSLSGRGRIAALAAKAVGSIPLALLSLVVLALIVIFVIDMVFSWMH